MLALSRKTGEVIVIGNDIEIVVLSVSGDQVKLGIEAPRNIPVHRKEIYDQIVEANKEATSEKTLLGIKDLIKKRGIK